MSYYLLQKGDRTDRDNIASGRNKIGLVSSGAAKIFLPIVTKNFINCNIYHENVTIYIKIILKIINVYLTIFTFFYY